MAKKARVRPSWKKKIRAQTQTPKTEGSRLDRVTQKS
jgi:hypothetical protein